MTAGGLDAAFKAHTASTEPVAVALGDKKVRVLPPMDWRETTLRAANEQRFTDWAVEALVNDVKLDKNGKRISGSDDSVIWAEANPTFREIVAFFAAYADVAGQSPGE